MRIIGRLTLVVGAAAVGTFLLPIDATGGQPPAAEVRQIEVPWAEQASAAGGPSEWVASRPFDADDTVMFGASWDADRSPVVEARVSRDGRWTDWFELDPVDEGPDPDSAEEAGANWEASEPVWVGRVDRIQVRTRRGDFDSGIKLEAVDIGGGDDLAFDPSRAGPGAAEAASQPSIIRRSSWDPNNECRPRTSASYAGSARFSVVHHTAGSNGYTSSQAANVVRSICLYHRNTLGWNDIGYNFLADRYGRTYEGRAGGIDRPVIGAHAAGFNSGSIGVAVMGCFESSLCSGDTSIPRVAIDAVDRLLAWKFTIHGIDPYGTTTETSGGGSSNKYPAGTVVTLPTIIGHLDVGRTACPGNRFYPFVRGSDPMRDRVAALMSSPSDPGPDRWIGVVRGNDWHLRKALSGGGSDWHFKYGRSDDLPVVGDWNADGQRTIGVFRSGMFYLRNSKSGGSADLSFWFGAEDDLPISGDWNRDGRTTIGTVRGNRWHLRNSNTAGWSDHYFQYGRASDVPVVGDWNGDGRTTIGVFRDGTWYLKNSLSGGEADIVIRYGRASDIPVTGDWNGNGGTTLGVVRDGRWFLKNRLSGGDADLDFPYGRAADTPISAY
jgi:hypothetical protein